MLLFPFSSFSVQGGEESLFSLFFQKRNWKADAGVPTVSKLGLRGTTCSVDSAPYVVRIPRMPQ